jgi:heme-degrading monooxygenase HmoA
MFILHIDMTVKPGSEQALEKAYRQNFRPAVSAQEGFEDVNLLRPSREDVNYRLSIAFDHQSSQQKWVATALHDQVWPMMATHCTECLVKYYASV